MLPSFSLQLHISGAVTDNTNYFWGNNGSKRKPRHLEISYFICDLCLEALFHLQKKKKGKIKYLEDFTH
jgi:hypothetical protein